MKLIIFITNFTSDNMRQTFTKLIATSIILVNSLIVFAKNDPNYPKGFTPKTTNGIAFTENKGQVYDQNYKPRTDVLYGAMAGNMAFHLKTNGVSYQLYRVDKYKDVIDERTKEKHKEIGQQTIYRIDLNWVNANKNCIPTTDRTLEGCNNYYLECCPSGALNVKSYTGVTLHNLYKGINLHYYEKQGQLKHDYIIAPNTDYKQIKLKVEGARIIINKDGSLILNTPLGKIQEGAPIVYQNGKTLKAKWQVNNNILSFEIENYNANLELIIDPITRLWGTYYGGAVTDYGMSCATDAIGNVYMAGSTDANTGTVIATSGAHQSTLGGGTMDAFLVKFNSNGVRQWGTYYGGNGSEDARSCSTDATGNVYLAGSTGSKIGTVIASTGAHQTVYSGGDNDAFLVKFNSSGVRQWGTYYGGTGNDVGYSCATDETGNVYLAGITVYNTGTVIATAGAHQTLHGGSGANDAYLVKFDASGVRQWGTYYGGVGDENGYSCATDATGNVYLTGYTTSNTGTVIATAGAHQPLFDGVWEAYLVKFDASGVRQWGTYYGGASRDYGFSCATDATGNVYLAGFTESNTGTVIATAGAHQTVHGGGGYDAFLVMFNSSGVRQWGTYYGGGGNDQGSSCAPDVNGNVHLAGWTNSNTGTVIATAGAHQTLHGGDSDAFLVKFNSSGVRQWGTYYGDIGYEEGRSCAIDAANNLYLAGYSTGSSGTVIATAGAHQTVNGGNFDAILAKFSDCISLNPSAITSGTLCAGTAINLSVSITGTATPSYLWTGPNSYTASVQNPSITNASTIHIGTYTVTINNVGCVETATTNLNAVNPSPSITVNSGSICSGQSFTLIPSGASTYTYSSGSAVVSPTSNANYNVIGTSSLGCVSSNTAVSSVTVNATPSITVNSGVICSGQSFTLVPNGASTYTYSSGSAIVSPTANANYNVIGTSSLGCVSSNTAVSSVTVNALPTVSVNSGSICSGQSFTLVPNGASTYTYSSGSAIVTPTANANYNVTGTSSLGCVSSNTAVSSVTVNALPTVSVNSGSICSGQSFTLVPSGASTYTYSSGSAIVSPTANANYNVTGTSSLGCVSSNTAVSSVTVNALPIITAVSSSTNYICVGQSATLTANGANTYSWSTTATSTVISVSPSVTTSYTVTGTDMNGCNNAATITQSVSTCTGLSQNVNSSNELIIFPNPFYNKITIVSNGTKQSVQVYNALGLSVYNTTIENEKIELDLTQQVCGIYFVRIGTVIKKLVKE